MLITLQKEHACSIDYFGFRIFLGKSKDAKTQENNNYTLFLTLSSTAFVLSCAFPIEPAGGDVSVTHLHAGGEAFFRCFTGYKLQGPKMLTCRNATTPYWSGKEPQCVGKTSCPPHHAPSLLNYNINLCH